MVDEQRLHQALAEFVHALTGHYRIGGVLYDLTDQCVAVLSCDAAGVAIRDDDYLQFVTATDEAVARLEERQIEDGEGPCHDAFQLSEQTVSPDLEAEPRWPTYRSLALRQGTRAVIAIPLVAQGQTLGALNLYWTQPHECSDEELEAAQLLADMAAGYVTNLALLEDTARLNKQLEHALDSRVRIEQAKGIIAERHGLDPGAAFELLRDHARSQRRKIHDIAGLVVEGELKL